MQEDEETANGLQVRGDAFLLIIECNVNYFISNKSNIWIILSIMEDISHRLLWHSVFTYENSGEGQVL